MKVLIYSDLHAHMWKQFGVDSSTDLPKRLIDQVLVLQQIGDIIKKEKVEYVINGGDTFHKVGEIPVEAINIVEKEYSNWGVSQEFVEGNHDLVDRKDSKWYQCSTTLFNKMFFKGRPEGLKIKLVGYADKIGEVIEGYDIVVLHKTPIHARVGNYEFKDGVNWMELSKHNKFIFFGHIHQHAVLNNNCFIVGAPMHLTFGDIGDRGIYLLDTDNWSVKFIELKYPKFLTIKDKKDMSSDLHYYRIYADKEDIIEKVNAIKITRPNFVEERIKGSRFLDILNEWVDIQNKPKSYVEELESILEEGSDFNTPLFKGRVLTVDVENFMSVGKCRYKLQGGFTFINGEDRDLVQSNGAGKSSMFGDAILWGLFGETTKGLKGDDVIRFGEKDCSVSVSMLLNSNNPEEESTYLDITRSRKKGLTIDNGGKIMWEGMKETDKQKNLEKMILGFNSKFFKSACYFSQEGLEMLTTMGDSDKSNMIASLLGFESYDNFYVKAFTEQKVHSESVNVYSNMIKDIETNLSYLVKLKEDADNKTKELNNEVGRITDKFKDKEEHLKEEIGKWQNEIDSLNEELKNAKPDKDALDKCECKEKEIQESLKFEKQKLDAVKDSIITNETKKKFAKQRITTLEGLESKCPVCDSEVSEEYKKDIIHNYEDDIAEMSSILDLKYQQRQEIEDSISEYEKGLSEIRNDRIKLIELENKANSITHKIGSTMNHLNSRQDELKELHKEKMEDLDNVKKKIAVAIADAERLYLKKEEEQNKIDDYEQKIKAHKIKANIFEFWKEAFGYKGIKALLLDRFCNEFNTIVSEYISAMSSGNIVVFMNPTKKLKSGEERNKLDISVIMNDVERKYESLSGGEKRRVDVAVCLALNEWAGRKYSNQDGFLGLAILDEVFSYIDRAGEETIASFLYNLGFTRTVLVISHTPELASYGYRVWNVIKENGVSELQTNE